MDACFFTSAFCAAMEFFAAADKSFFSVYAAFGKFENNIILEFYGLQDRRLHVAVALDKNTFIHATENQGVRISSFASSKTYLKLANIYEVI
mgnify:CR=1 FL=1